MTLTLGQPAYIISGTLADPAIFDVQVTWIGEETVRIVDVTGARFVPRCGVFASRELARLALVKVAALGAA